MYADVVRYCAFGDHRTASEADLRTVAWLKTRLRDLGFETQRQPFRVRQFFLGKCRLTVQGEGVDAFPLWCPQPAGRRPLAARLAEFPGGYFTPGDIALVTFPPVSGAT